jgi:hypothetical protein
MGMSAIIRSGTTIRVATNYAMVKVYMENVIKLIKIGENH